MSEPKDPKPWKGDILGYSVIYAIPFAVYVSKHKPVQPSGLGYTDSRANS